MTWVGSMRRKSRASVCSADLAERAGQLDAGRPAADDDEGQPRRAAPTGSRLALGGLVGEEHAAPDLERVLDRLEPGRELRPLVVAEVRVGRAGRDDQVVVGELAVVEDDAACAATSIARRLGEQHARVAPGARRTARIGYAMSLGFSAAVATW